MRFREYLKKKGDVRECLTVMSLMCIREYLREIWVYGR
jgi:hypothetical protein